MGLLKTPSWYCSKGLCRRTICIAGSCTAFFKVSVAFLDKKPTDFLIGYGADLLRIFTSSCRCAIEPYLSVSKNKSITLKGNCLRHTFFETQLLNTTFCSRCVFKKHINTTPNANIFYTATQEKIIFLLLRRFNIQALKANSLSTHFFPLVTLRKTLNVRVAGWNTKRRLVRGETGGWLILCLEIVQLESNQIIF